MIGWLLDVLTKQKCDHKWEIYKEINVFSHEGAKTPIGKEYHLRCEFCGDIKIVTHRS